MNFIIKNRIISAEKKSLVGDNADYTASFEFDDEWSGKIKTVRFESEKGTYYDVLLSADETSCTIPVEVLKMGYVNVGVFTAEMTTTPVSVRILGSIKEKSGSPVAPSEDVYAQIIRLIETIEIGGVTLPTKLSEFINDEGFITADSIPKGFSGDYNDLSNKPTIPTVPTDISAFNNDSGFITENDIPEIPIVPTDLSEFNNDVGYITDADIPAPPTVPTKVSQLENDSEFLTVDTLPIYNGGVENG